MALSHADRQAIEGAFDEAQARTSAPLMGVVAEASSDYALAPLAASLVIALAAPWPLLFFTAISAERIFAAQLALCLIALALFAFAPARVALTPRRARRAIAHRAALVQFAVRGLDRAPGRNAVLIYVSLVERYARVIAGDEACRHVTQAQWQGLIEALTADIAEAGARVAMCAAAARAAELLAPHFPSESAGAPKSLHFHAI